MSSSSSYDWMRKLDSFNEPDLVDVVYCVPCSVAPRNQPKCVAERYLGKYGYPPHLEMTKWTIVAEGIKENTCPDKPGFGRIVAGVPCPNHFGFGLKWFKTNFYIPTGFDTVTGNPTTRDDAIARAHEHIKWLKHGCADGSGSGRKRWQEHTDKCEECNETAITQQIHALTKC